MTNTTEHVHDASTILSLSLIKKFSASVNCNNPRHSLSRTTTTAIWHVACFIWRQCTRDAPWLFLNHLYFRSSWMSASQHVVLRLGKLEFFARDATIASKHTCVWKSPFCSRLLWNWPIADQISEDAILVHRGHTVCHIWANPNVVVYRGMYVYELISTTMRELDRNWTDTCARMYYITYASIT